MSNRIAIRDHLGNDFNSIKEMSVYHNIPYAILRHRLRDLKMDVKEALETKFEVKGPNYVPAEDHLGNQFKSIADMARHYGLRPQELHSQLNYRPLEEILTKTPFSRATDHLGNKYASNKDMVKHYGINYSTYTYRIRQGWSKAKALTTKIN